MKNKKILGFATLTLHRWGIPDKQDYLITKYVKRFNISAIEITTGAKNDLYSFKLSKESKFWLRKRKYVSIHAPFRLIRNAKNQKEVIKQLDIIQKIYNDLDAKNVVIHPTDLPYPKILNKYDFNISIENLAPRRHITTNHLKRIFKKYPKAKLCLDVSHAYLWSKYETRNLIKVFKNRIQQVHFSGTYRKKTHQSLRKVTKDFLWSIEPIKKLNIPILIEGDIRTKNFKAIQKEVEYIRSLIK